MAPFGFDRRELFGVLLALGVDLKSAHVLAAEPIAVVMSNATRQRSLSSDKLRRVFLALPTDSEDGNRFVPVNLGQSSNVRERFDRNVLKMSPEQVSRYWIDQRLRGNKPPKSASSHELVRRVVQELPGAISYLPLSAVGSLRVLSIDGRPPSDGAYGLR